MITSKVAQKMDFTNRKIYIGLDVHKKNWNVSIFVEKQYFKAFQQAPKPDVLIKYLHDNFPGGIYECAYEAGFCGFWIQRELSDKGISCIVVNPADIPITNKERNNKRDPVDSKRIASALEDGKLNPIYIPSIQLEADRRIVRLRKTITNDLTRSKNRIKSELFLIGIEIPGKYKGWSKPFIEWLKALDLEHKNWRSTLDVTIQRMEQLRSQLLLLNRDIRKLIKEDRYKKIGEQLLKISGVGVLTAITVLTEIGEIERFETFDRLNSYIGYCPTEHSSGESEQKGGLTPRGNSQLRELLVESSWIATRTDPTMAACYADLTKRMTGKRAIIRIARKVLNRIYGAWKNGLNYQTGIN
jgi:transposase